MHQSPNSVGFGMPLYPKPEACRGCSAYSVGQSYVKATGPLDATIVFMGQGPGEQEAYNGLPFVGPAGQRLNAWLRTAGIDRHKCYFDNVVRCWLPGNRTPKEEEIKWCREAHWETALNSLPNLRCIVPVGVPAGKVFLGKHYKSSQAGSIVRWHGNETLESVASEGTPH